MRRIASFPPAVAVILCVMTLAGQQPSPARAVETTERSENRPSDAAAFPSLISTLRITEPLDFCGERVPMEIPEVRESMEKELLLFMWDRAQIILWVKRTGKYWPYIEQMLKKNKMPDDLKYVAVVESALLPHIGSSAGAVGYWQFIPSTGRRYGLRIDKHIDERRNLFSATKAAIRYLRKLHGDFGKWTLAAAAYNMGEQGLQRRIDRQRTSDYYHLYLPQETERYIFKIIAAKLILSNPRKYGFHFTREDLYEPLRFDRVKVNLTRPVPVMTLAQASGTYYKTIKEMNPEIRGDELVSGEHTILVPDGASRNFHARLSSLFNTRAEPAVTSSPTSSATLVYVVKEGDFLSKIAGRFNVTVSELRQWNNLHGERHIHPGQRLIIRK